MNIGHVHNHTIFSAYSMGKKRNGKKKKRINANKSLVGPINGLILITNASVIDLPPPNQAFSRLDVEGIDQKNVHNFKNEFCDIINTDSSNTCIGNNDVITKNNTDTHNMIITDTCIINHDITLDDTKMNVADITINDTCVIKNEHDVTNPESGDMNYDIVKNENVMIAENYVSTLPAMHDHNKLDETVRFPQCTIL